MSFKVITNVAIVILLAAVIILYSMTSAVNVRDVLLATEVASLKDSLATLQHRLDTVKSQLPGLGEYMSTIQLHIAKLWYAGRGPNWKLADFELKELDEAFTAAEGLHETRNNVNISSVLQSVQQTQFALVSASIKSESSGKFLEAYDQTVAACNGCHQSAGYKFIQIVHPLAEPVMNQRWK